MFLATGRMKVQEGMTTLDTLARYKRLKPAFPRTAKAALLQTLGNRLIDVRLRRLSSCEAAYRNHRSSSQTYVRVASLPWSRHLHLLHTCSCRLAPACRRCSRHERWRRCQGVQVYIAFPSASLRGRCVVGGTRPAVARIASPLGNDTLKYVCNKAAKAVTTLAGQSKPDTSSP